jgi:SAM-dependent methyltransferase
MTTQEEVTDFYNRQIFPSKTSHKAYSELVPNNLSGLRVGDFGCGRSLFIDSFKTAGCDAIFLDISENALATIDYGRKIQASLTDIPLENQYMDVIYCIGVVHHIPELEEALSELMRVLKKGGTLYLGVYAEKSLQAGLRKLYENLNLNFFKKTLYALSGLLIWIKNYKNNLKFGSDEHDKRIDDLLKTPLVRYLPVKFYLKILEKHGMILHDVKRISCMNVIIIEKK